MLGILLFNEAARPRWAPTASQSIAGEGSGVQGDKRRNRVKKCKALSGRELTQETQDDLGVTN